MPLAIIFRAFGAVGRSSYEATYHAPRNDHDLKRTHYNHPEICHGKPTIRGLRYPVEMIPELLSSGMSFEEILNEEDILAVLDYARRCIQTNRIE